MLIGSGCAWQPPGHVVGRERRCAADTTGVKPGEQQASVTTCVNRHAHCTADSQPAWYWLTPLLDTTTTTIVLLLFWNLSGTAWVSRYQKGKNQEGKTNLNLLEQEIVSGSGICWAICKSAPHPR